MANTVTGLANAAGVQTLATVGTPTVDDLHDAHGPALAANANASRWFMHSRDFSTQIPH